MEQSLKLQAEFCMMMIMALINGSLGIMFNIP